MTDRIPLDAMTSDQLDALYERLERAETGPRSQWPAAEPLQHAAAALRDGTASPASIPPAVLADWLDATANALAWLAPYRPHEGGYAMWGAASRVAEALPAPATEETS